MSGAGRGEKGLDRHALALARGRESGHFAGIMYRRRLVNCIRVSCQLDPPRRRVLPGVILGMFCYRAGRSLDR
jgi:hypothetical protein